VWIIHLVNRGLGNGQCILKETVSNDFQLFPFIECRLINADGKALLFFSESEKCFVCEDRIEAFEILHSKLLYSIMQHR
jgi:hypothetical protein